MKAPTMCRHVLVHGHVQGVFYRDWTVRTATELGVTGWVRNLADGTVEAVVCGEAAEEMIERMHAGPERARVDKIEAHRIDMPAAPEEFRKRSDAGAPCRDA